MNSLRGEAEVKIGPLRVSMVITMGGLASLSSAIGATSLQDVYQRLVGVEPFAAMAAIRSFTTAAVEVAADGSESKPLKSKLAADAAIQAYGLDDTAELQAGFSKLLMALVRGAPKSEADDPNA